MTRQGRFGSLTFVLVPNSGGPPPAEVTFWEMELHAATRGERTAGITDLKVAADERRKGYAKALLTEVIRRLRDEMVSRVEVSIRSENEAALNLFRALQFEPFDTGVVYRKMNSMPAVEDAGISRALQSRDQRGGGNVAFESV